GLCPLVAML
nr:Chain P, 9-meric peptide from mRNA export factor EB2 [human gammaherpesvirus 4]